MIPIDTLTTTLQIRMFGDFAIQYGDRVLTGNIGRSKKVWALIEYLLANRGKEISPDRMMEDLWPDEEYDDPFHILKNLIYRARTALRTLSGLRSQLLSLEPGNPLRDRYRNIRAVLERRQKNRGPGDAAGICV